MSVDLPGSSDRYPAKSGIRAPPFGFLVPKLLQLYLDSSMASLPPLVHGFPCPNNTIGTSRFDISSLPGRQGFLFSRLAGLPDFIGLSHQCYPWIGSAELVAGCHPQTPHRASGSPSRLGFIMPMSVFGYQARRTSLGKTHHLPISRPTSQRFGSPDIRSRSATPARPPLHCHIVGSLFATYMGSASCFLQTPHFWELPLPCRRCPSVR